MTNKAVKNDKDKSDKPKKSGAFKFLVFAAIFYTVFIIVVVFSFRTEGSNDLDRTSFCYDTWGVFNDQQIADINDHCKKIQKKKDLTVLVVTCERRVYESGYYGHTYYEAMLTGDSFCVKYDVTQDNNFAIIIINTQKDSDTQICFDYHFDIYTYGDSYDKINDGEIESILFSEGGDKMLVADPEIAKDGVIECVSLLGTAYSWFIPGAPWSKICLISVSISAIIALIVVLLIKKSYTRDRKNSTFSFASNSKLMLNIKNDNYVRSTTTYVRIRTHTSTGSGSSGRSGGFGGFKGGGFSGGGGGGGHRGGR